MDLTTVRRDKTAFSTRHSVMVGTGQRVAMTRALLRRVRTADCTSASKIRSRKSRISRRDSSRYQLAGPTGPDSLASRHLLQFRSHHLAATGFQTHSKPKAGEHRCVCRKPLVEIGPGAISRTLLRSNHAHALAGDSTRAVRIRPEVSWCTFLISASSSQSGLAEY